MNIEDLIIGLNEVNLKHDEFVVNFEVNTLEEGVKWSFIKLGRRNSLAIARINIAVITTTDKTGLIKDVKICLGAVLPNFKKIRKAEDIMIGERPTDLLIDKVATVVVDEILEITGIRSSTEYKIPVIQALTKRALGEVAFGRENNG